MTSIPLRALDGSADVPATLAESAVVLIDYQNTYTTGVMELTGWDPALDHAADLLARARAAGAPVIHVQHDSGPGSPYDITAPIGRIHDRVAPVAGEEVVTKTAPNSFVDTPLADLIAATGRRQVVLAGFMTHMCVTFTAEGTALRGYDLTVVADACATRALPSAAGDVPAEQLHAAALATIGDAYGAVVGSAADLR
ncbi:cysteine hydrolase family protein [Pimelobacter sp. 30-1]|uniref:cysteine hydrolase family protein n=1 Tax=Pimelobacter sp. 30-1 TaxID=2004991 RepID=UPI001C04A6F9|nr:cysteine hydrolase family protein [Pimelobacter sp. 30-1]MBU2695469.1 cysteine hydrolase [Pimelobacter sp. 30-1]